MTDLLDRICIRAEVIEAWRNIVQKILADLPPDFPLENIGTEYAVLEAGVLYIRCDIVGIGSRELRLAPDQWQYSDGRN